MLYKSGQSDEAGRNQTEVRNSAGILACGFWLALFHIANVIKFGLMCQIDESGDYLSGNRHSDG